MAYSLEFTRTARRELESILRDTNDATRRNFQAAFAAIQSNPYPTNPGVTPGTIRRLQGTSAWRFRVGNYRIRYTIRSTTVRIDRVRHRREAYRN